MDISEILPSASIQEFLDVLPDAVVVTGHDGLIVAANERLCALSGYPIDALIGSWIEGLIPSRFQAEHVALRSTYVRDGAPARAMSARSDIVLRTAGGHEVPVDVSLSSIDGGATPVVVAAVRDASVRREAELVREREYRFLSAMGEITDGLFASGDIDGTYRAVAQQSRRLLRADAAFLAVPEAGGSYLRAVVSDGHAAASFDDSQIPLDESVAGLVFRERQAILIADASSDNRFHRPAHWPDDLGPALVVPLHARDEILATLTITNRRGGTMFNASEVALMNAFAGHAALALLDARNQQTQHRIEILEDRERVAHAMHDHAINRVSTASLVAHSLLQSSENDQTAERLWEIVDELDEAIKAIRDAVFPR